MSIRSRLHRLERRVSFRADTCLVDDMSVDERAEIARVAIQRLGCPDPLPSLQGEDYFRALRPCIDAAGAYLPHTAQRVEEETLTSEFLP